MGLFQGESDPAQWEWFEWLLLIGGALLIIISLALIVWAAVRASNQSKHNKRQRYKEQVALLAKEPSKQQQQQQPEIQSGENASVKSRASTAASSSEAASSVAKESPYGVIPSFRDQQNYGAVPHGVQASAAEIADARRRSALEQGYAEMNLPEQEQAENVRPLSGFYGMLGQVDQRLQRSQAAPSTTTAENQRPLAGFYGRVPSQPAPSRANPRPPPIVYSRLPSAPMLGTQAAAI